MGVVWDEKTALSNSILYILEEAVKILEVKVRGWKKCWPRPFAI